MPPPPRALVTADLPTTVGTVKSVTGGSTIGGLALTGGPITSTGTLALGTTSIAQNLIFASPYNITGSASFRSMNNSDLASAVFGASGTLHAAGAVPDPGATAGTTHYLREDGSWVVPPGGSGTVTSVAAAADAGGVLSWTGSPITASGTLTPVFNSQSGGLGTVFAAPASGPGAPVFRALQNGDFSSLALSGGVTSTGTTTTVASVAGATAANVASATNAVTGSKAVNTVLAASTGGSGTATFRTLVPSDLAAAIFVASGSSHAVGAVPDPGATAGRGRGILVRNAVR